MTLEYCTRLLDCWVLGAADAAGLWDAVEAAGLLGIRYCARLLDVDLYAKTRTGFLGIGYC